MSNHNPTTFAEAFNGRGPMSTGGLAGAVLGSAGGVALSAENARRNVLNPSQQWTDGDKIRFDEQVTKWADQAGVGRAVRYVHSQDMDNPVASQPLLSLLYERIVRASEKAGAASLQLHGSCDKVLGPRPAESVGSTAKGPGDVHAAGQALLDALDVLEGRLNDVLSAAHRLDRIV